MIRPRDWALVTGAGSGIGMALTAALVERGVGVALVGRQAERLKAVAASFGDGAGLVVPADITQAEDRDRIKTALAAALAAKGGVLRFLVHNAGVGDPAPDFSATSPRDLAHALDVNVIAPLALTQMLLPQLRQGAPARVLMVGAGIADRPQPGTGAYGISKAATARLMRQMATDFDYEADPDAPLVCAFR